MTPHTHTHTPTHTHTHTPSHTHTHIHTHTPTHTHTHTHAQRTSADNSRWTRAEYSDAATLLGTRRATRRRGNRQQLGHHQGDAQGRDAWRYEEAEEEGRRGVISALRNARKTIT